jgi:hypothetical protein
MVGVIGKLMHYSIPQVLILIGLHAAVDNINHPDFVFINTAA